MEIERQESENGRIELILGFLLRDLLFGGFNETGVSLPQAL